MTPYNAVGCLHCRWGQTMLRQPHVPLQAFAVFAMFASLGPSFVQRYQDSQVTAARIKAIDLAKCVKRFHVNNGRYPWSIEELTKPQPNGGQPFCDEQAITDPWGQPFRILLHEDEKGGTLVEVFTFSPRGERFSNIERPEEPADCTSMIVALALIAVGVAAVWLSRARGEQIPPTS